MTQHELSFGTIDQRNVPPGMVAVLKAEARFQDNFCHHCDYRPDCIAAGAKAIPCSEYRRPDRTSVYFTKEPANA